MRGDVMSMELQTVIAAGFAALLATAAFEDIRRLVIPNQLTLGLLLLWPIHLAVTPTTLTSGAEAAAGAFAVLLCGTLLFARGLIGGGDVKLLTAAALWAGAARLPSLLLLTGLLGGALSLLLLTPLGAQIAAGVRVGSGQRGAVAIGANTAVPYGAAIAGAALIVAFPLQWS